MSGHLNCGQMLADLSDYVDGELAQELCIEIERHLSECDNCRVVVNTLRKTIEIVHQTCGDEEFPEAVRQRLLACLHLPGPENPALPAT